MIKDSEIVKRYQDIEKVLNQNEDLKSKINEIKTIQKQMVNAKEIGKVEAVKHFESLYETCLSDIEESPLMSEYLALQSEINEMIQHVAQIIEDGINKELNSK